MRTTKSIKERLVWVRSELDRINTLLMDGTYKETDHFVHAYGLISQADWTFKDALTKYVSERITLEWVLNINH